MLEFDILLVKLHAFLFCFRPNSYNSVEVSFNVTVEYIYIYIKKTIAKTDDFSVHRKKCELDFSPTLSSCQL